MQVTFRQFNFLKIISFLFPLILIIPLLYILFYGYGPFYVKSIAFSKTVISSIELSIFSAVIAIGIIILLFSPLAYYLSRHKNPVLETFVDIPASVPHPLVGIALVFMDSPLTPFGKFLLSHGINFYYTYLGIIYALIIVSSPIYIRAMQNYYEGISRSYEDFAKGLGASETRIFFRIMLPLSVKGIISAGLTSIARSISEFGSIFIVAPYVTGWIFNGDCVASVYIYNEYQSYFNASITAAATLLVFSFALIIAVRIVNHFLK
ncbi:ABC transporter permease subunit [Acidianus sulfidivorans JP7]|uniref:Sulfate ABC transporter permease n=1 Tax=Acidianus sulfidivorans JP7 TaxID=619593 RepID=A0A2U9INP2_9CREN|nr:ABC transporter permease [Acidianus sulfidivorans]AWR97678.1 ABC transporter permease subunit [Acidianus sulfidivorans JP7]